MVKVLELFAGIGACSKALEYGGEEYEIVDAVEIDKYAISSFNAIHGTEFKVQDITEWDKDVEVDLIMHGSPCQDFSVAGKQAGGDIGSGTRSSLMYETIRIVGKIRPRYVIWENVKNILSKKHRHNFDSYLDTMKALGYRNYYEVLNAKDYGVPQNRERVFTISIRNDVEGEFEFPEKEELKIRLKDVLEEEVEGKYYLDDKQLKRLKTTNYERGKFENRVKDENGIMSTLCARDYKDPQCVQVGELDMKGFDQMKRVYSGEGISPTLTCMGGGNTEPKIITCNIPQMVRVRKYPVDTDKLKEVLREAKIETEVTNREIAEELGIPITKVEHYFRKDDCFAIPEADLWLRLKSLLKITTDEFDESIMTFEEREGTYEKSERCYCGEGIAPTLTQQEEKIIIDNSVKPSVAENFEREKEEILKSDKDIYEAQCEKGWNDNKVGLKISPTIRESSSSIYGLDNNYRIRKLTPKECWRLMGFRDCDFEKAAKVCSNSQLYKQAGNSICVPVLQGILRNLLKGEQK